MLLLLLNQDVGLTEGSFAGTSAAAFVGQARIDAVLSSAGVGALSATGNAIKASALSSAGVGATSLVGSNIAGGVFTSAGVADIFIGTDSTPYIGGDGFVRGTFSRGQWRDFREEKTREARERERRAKEKAEREAAERKRKREEEKAAREAARQERLRELEAKSAENLRAMFMNEATGIAPRIGELNQTRLSSIVSMAQAQQALARQKAEMEEREALELLMSS